MNRQERRRLGKRRAFGIAGVSLAAATGLFGTYLGNPRLPRAYAVSPACDATVTTDAQLRAAILSSQDDWVICVQGSIPLLSDLPALDDTTVTFVGTSLGAGIDGQGQWAGISADFNGVGDDTLTISGLTIQDDSSIKGAGVYITSAPSDALIVTDSTFTQNHAAGQGGAIYAQGARVAISGSTFQGNSAGSDGGALFIDDTAMAGTALEVYVSSFSGNTATMGGAIFASSSYITLANSFSGGNYASIRAGSIMAYGSPTTLQFSTLYDDSAPAGATQAVAAFYYSNLSVIGSVIASSTDDTVVDAVYSTVDDTFSVFTGSTPVHTGTGSRTVAPGSLQLGALDGSGPGEQGRSPAPSSVLVTDAPSSDLGTGVATDQLGNGRPSPGESLWTIGARQVASAPPPPPPPAPVFPASAPRDVTGVAGDGSVAVSWLPPADAGSFPVTDYRVTAGPGGRSCLAKAPALTCMVTGLTNGTAYTFVVTALNGAGWGPSSVASAPVTPSADRARSLTLFQGKRTANGVHDRIRTGGTSVGVPEGARLTPWIRYGDTGAFKEGVASIVVDARGRFTWTREIRKDKKFVAYVAYEDLESNRVVWTRVR
jgi:predicted outer membrane repeat protein